MLIAHHMIDVLRGNVRRPELINMGRDSKMPMRTADLIDRAQKFDFGELHLEQLQAGPVYSLPKLTADEMGFWRDGLIPLPFEVCWFEFTLNGFRSGLLIEERGSEWRIMRIDWLQDAIALDGIVAVVDRAVQGDDLTINITGNTELYHRLHELGTTEMARATAQSIGSSTPLAIYFTLMLNSKTTEVVLAMPAPRKLNRSRIRRGRAPLPDHRIVTIVPHRFRQDAERGDGRGRGRRLHWRRSHARHFDHNTPLARWSPETSHGGRKGWWVTVIPRHLVGRSELGEVSHEYRIAQPEEVAA